MKRVFALLLLVCLLMCACAKENVEPTTVPQPTETTAAPTEPTTEATEPPTEPPTEAPTEPVGFQNPLTGQFLSEPMLNRPYGVVMDNDEKSSGPHWGCGQADMIWELPHEGGTTRMLGIFSDISDVDRLGPNRSVRPYLLSVSQSFGALLVHAGGSPQGYDMLKKTGCDHLDGVQGPNAGKYYHRDQDRLNAGVKSWHTMYTTGQEILDYTAERGYDNTYDEAADFGLNFAVDATPDGQAAHTVYVRFKDNGKKTTLYYQEDTGLYSMEQFNSTYVDGNNGEAVYFKNILVLETSVKTIDTYGRLGVTLEGSGSGYFACGGQMVAINWSRSSAEEPFVFTLADGTPLTLGIGTTYAAVVYNGAPISCE